MNYIDTLFSALMDEPMPKTHEYVENRTIRGLPVSYTHLTLPTIYSV